MQKSGILKKIKRTILNVGFVSLFVAPMGTAYALSDCAGMSYCTVGSTNIQPTNCKTMTSGVLYGNYCLYSCNTCESGYTKVAVTENLTGCSKTYYDCEKDFTTTTCTATTYSSSTCGTTPAYTLSNCSSVTKKCFGGKYVQTCNTCSSGTRTSTTYKPSGCSNSYTYYYCKSSLVIDPDDPFIPVDPVDPVGECSSDTDCGFSVWRNVSGTNYQSKTTYTCLYPGTVKSKCSSSTSYRCKAGYYGSSTSCTACPSPTDTLTSGSVTSAAGTTAMTGCYLTSGSVLKDSAGNTYDFTADCSYSN